MEIIKWENGQGCTIKLDRDEADELIRLIYKALTIGRTESETLTPMVDVEII